MVIGHINYIYIITSCNIVLYTNICTGIKASAVHVWADYLPCAVSIYRILCCVFMFQAYIK